jgi:hypothetical protein
MLMAWRHRRLSILEPPHVWMAPELQEFFRVMNSGRLQSCVRPFSAVLHDLALMDSASRGLISWSGSESR